VRFGREQRAALLLCFQKNQPELYAWRKPHSASGREQFVAGNGAVSDFVIRKRKRRLIASWLRSIECRSIADRPRARREVIEISVANQRAELALVRLESISCNHRLFSSPCGGIHHDGQRAHHPSAQHIKKFSCRGTGHFSTDFPASRWVKHGWRLKGATVGKWIGGIRHRYTLRARMLA